MKSSILVLAFTLLTLAIPVKSNAAGFWQYGTLFGNICRNGPYYQAFPNFSVVGYNCYMPAWNLYGVVTTQ